MTAQDILSRLQGVRGGRGQWTARCPAHDDRQNSLSVSEGNDGRVLLHCHAGCDVDRITAALGISPADLFPDKPRTADLDEKANKAGYSFTAVKRAKQDLKKDGAVKYFQTGSNANRAWNIQALVEPEGVGFEELPDDTETPFENPIPSSISKVV